MITSSAVDPDSKSLPPAYDDRSVYRGMEPERRHSIELEERPLPEGWVRQFDPNTQHHFYVDTRTSPPRSIWNHPFDDPEYLKAHPEAAFDSNSDSSDSESDDDDRKSTEKRRKEPRHSPQPPVAQPPQQQQQQQVAGPSAPRVNNNSSTGLMGMFKQIFGMDDERRREQERIWNERYTNRRQYFQANQSFLPQGMGGSMYPNRVQMYAPPPGAFYRDRDARRETRRMYRDMRREVRHEGRDVRKMVKAEIRNERRMAKAQRRAIRRGYLIPTEQIQRAPLFGYAHPR